MSKKETMFYKQLGKEIAKQRMSQDLTQEQLGEKLGIGNEAVSRIERGAVATSTYKLYCIADIVGCSVQSFFVETSRRPADQTEKLLALLEPLSATDRQFIVRIVEQLAMRFQDA